MKFLSSKRFVVQLILIFAIFTLGTLIALGLPAALLLNRQNNLQVRALADQANQTALALLNEKRSQLENNALLLIERPTLNQILFWEQDRVELETYLAEFLSNSNIEAIVICESENALAVAGESGFSSMCQFEGESKFAMVEGTAWLLARADWGVDRADQPYIVVGEQANTILENFKSQSSLDYLLLYDGEAVASNVDELPAQLQDEIDSGVSSNQRIKVVDEGGQTTVYQSTIVPLTGGQNFTLVGLLNIESFLALSKQLRNLVWIAFLAVSLAGAVVAVFVSRRISKPLDQLARSAVSLREGDLTTPLVSSSKIWEMDQLTNALEDARVGLKHSIDQLKMEKLWIENMLNSIVEGILTVDEKNRITYVSKTIENMLGVEMPHLLGRPMDEYFVAVEGEDDFSQQIPGENQSARISALLNGREVLLQVSVSTFIPPEAGNATRALVIRDVTDEERIHRLIGEFMANITHEFRTPLSALSASVELLVDQLPDLSTQEIGQLLHALNIGIIDLQSLIDNLIEAASIEAGRFKVNPRQVALGAITQASVDTVLPIAQKRGLEIVQPAIRQGFLVMADQRRTTQVLVNLLSNAIKHSPENGTVTIRSLMLENHVLIEVQDEGEGVAPERQLQLFNRFISGGSDHDLSLVGMGLGLSVVKAIVEAQGGKVGYKVGEPRGAIFWFTLPLVRN